MQSLSFLADRMFHVMDKDKNGFIFCFVLQIARFDICLIFKDKEQSLALPTSPSLKAPCNPRRYPD